ncbi:MAG: hypothetical protein KDD15_05905, partial [Lewinella sp.]|nr:hypothetical protein [Lewinella sp.]
PSVGDVITLLEYARVSIFLDLSLYQPAQKVAYVTAFMQALSGLRARRGIPHWFLIDEAHYFCSQEGGILTDLLLENARFGGFTFVTYQSAAMPVKLLRAVDHWMFTRIRDRQELRHLKHALGTRSCSGLEQLHKLSNKQLYLCLGETNQMEPPVSGVIELDKVSRATPHVRHLHKYLLAPLPADKQFYFHLNSSDRSVRPAASLWEFLQALPLLSPKTIKYHLGREDFERWVREVIHDEELSRQIHKLAQRDIAGEAMKDALYDTVSHRFDELESLI